MTGFFGAVWWFIVTLGVLVTFHEFGHYWVARRCGVKVLRFSIGFGRPLWSRLGKDGTRYQVAMIPLGGYVQFLDEREAEIDPAERERAFNRQSVLKRIAIVSAGPLANLLLCVVLLWTAFMIGRPGLVPILGSPVGLAADAGLRQGDRIVQVGDDLTPTWDQALTPLALAAIDRRPLTITVRDSDGHNAQRLLPLDRLPADFNQADPMAAIGLRTIMADNPPVVGQVSPGFPADGRLQPGDRILGIARISGRDHPGAKPGAGRPDRARQDARLDALHRRGADRRGAGADLRQHHCADALRQDIRAGFLQTRRPAAAA